MTNLEHLKRCINAQNLCDILNCAECPMFNQPREEKPCFMRLREWAAAEYKPAQEKKGI